MFSLENLCIESEKAVWILYIDLLCICNDGNLFDTCLLSIVSSLKTLKIPHTCKTKNDDTIYIDNRNKNNFYKLSLKYDLLPLTFGILDKKIIVDPTIDEQLLLTDLINIVLNNNGDIIHLHKSGQKNINFNTLQNMIQLAQKRAHKLIQILNKKCQMNDQQIIQQIDYKIKIPKEKSDQYEDDEEDHNEKEEDQDDEDDDLNINPNDSQKL